MLNFNPDVNNVDEKALSALKFDFKTLHTVNQLPELIPGEHIMCVYKHSNIAN